VSELDLKGKRVLVTGGAGFIGSHLAERLLQAGCTVIAYDNFDNFYTGKERNVRHLLKNERFRLLVADILDYDSLLSVMREVDVVFHEAAQCGVRYCIQHPWKAHVVNVTGTLNVLWAAKQAGVKKLVYASSSGIFGHPAYLPMDEKHPTNPNSPYGVTKLAAEKYCVAFHEVYGLNTVSLRYFSVYGPRGRPDQVIYAFASSIFRGERPIIYGDGTQTRDFTYVSDVVEATLLAAECDDVDGEVFNIGFGRRFSINEVFKAILDRLDVGGGVQPVYRETYRGEFPHTLADNTKSRRILGWKPKTDLSEGLDLFIKWFIHEHGRL